MATGAANNQGTTDNTTGRLIPIEIGAAMTFDALFSGTTSYVPGQDPEVRRLEAPHRRRKVG